MPNCFAIHGITEIGPQLFNIYFKISNGNPEGFQLERYGNIQFIKKTTGRKRLLSTALHKRCEYLYRTNKQGNIFYSLQLNYGIMLLLTPDHAEKQCQQACSFKSCLYNSGIKDKTCSVS